MFSPTRARPHVASPFIQVDATMQSKLADALDKLASPRSSTQSQKDALNSLERTIAELVLVEKHHRVQDELNTFIKLQDSFQCNIASRILFWLAHRTQTLMKFGDRRSPSADKDDEFGTITSALLQALSLLQGVALMHKPSKDFLCRNSSIEVFIDLLSICRQASARPFANLSSGSPKKSSSNDYPWDPSLVSVVIDTLLCILSDAPSALRCFEEARGIEHIVKILKRPAIPKDIRIKCLEFIYFYLMDESVPSSADVSTRPSSPVKRSRIFPSHHSRFSTSSSGSSNSSGSAFSFGSWSPTATLAGTPPVSPKKSASRELPHNPTNNALDMLRKDVDFVPQSPKRGKVAQLDGGARRPGTPQSMTPLKVPQTNSKSAQEQLNPLSQLASEKTLYTKPDVESGVLRYRTSGTSGEGRNDYLNGESHSVQIRTIQEKKEILGQLLGNVDALVEGVKKAGIWGLGE